MHAHLRPYLVDGTQEMINEEYYREAVGWAMAFYGASMQVIQRDAPSQLTPTMQAKFTECLRHFALDALASWKTRLEEAKVVFREVFLLADEIVACNPAIFD